MAEVDLSSSIWIQGIPFSSAEKPASSLPPLQTKSELIPEGRHSVVPLW